MPKSPTNVIMVVMYFVLVGSSRLLKPLSVKISDMLLKRLFIIGLLMSFYSVALAQEGYNLSRQPLLGNVNAPVQILVFEDFSCRHCKRFNELVLPRLLRDYVLPGDAYIVFLNYPILGNDSFFAAWAGECAYRQSNIAFWRYKMYIFSHQRTTDDWASPDSLTNIARTYVPELNVEELNHCILNGDVEKDVLSDFEYGQSLDIQGTPTLIINGESYTGTDYSLMRDLIDLSLEEHAQTYNQPTLQSIRAIGN